MKPIRGESRELFDFGRTALARDLFARPVELSGVPMRVPSSRAFDLLPCGRSTDRSMPKPSRSDSRSDDATPDDASARRLERFLLWIDAVGGYFVTLRNEAILGQAHASTGVDYPIQADLRPRHARLFRRESDWFVEPIANASGLAPVFVEGRKIDSATHLADGDELLLGESTLLRFRQPHPYSASATLEIVSRHRTAPHTDGLLLLAETAILGPDWNSHVVCRRFAEKLVLIARGGTLRLRATGDLRLFASGTPGSSARGTLDRDGKRFDGQCELTGDCRVSGEGFSMSLETLPQRDA